MTNWRGHIIENPGFLLSCALALICAGLFTAMSGADSLPGLGAIPLVPAVLLAACCGLPLLLIIHNKGIGSPGQSRLGSRGVLAVFMLGAVLSLPPIAIDIFWQFPAGINVLPPAGLLFYPAIALVAEVSFHIAPLALLCAISPRNTPALVRFAPVVFVEPIFQTIWATGPAIQSWLVFGNVSLISAAQLWLFWKYGFTAMIALRLSFYLFWHIVWGTVRLPVLF